MGDSYKPPNLKVVQRLVSIAFLVCSAVYLAIALSVPLGTVGRPGPGLVPAGIGICLTFLCLLQVIQVFFFAQNGSSALGESEPVQRPDVLRVVGIISFLTLYLIFFSFLGYTLSTVILMAAVLRLLGVPGWMRVLLISVLISVCSFYVFDRFLDVPLPKGSLFL